MAKRHTAIVVAIVVLILALIPYNRSYAADKDDQLLKNCKITVDDTEYTVKAIDYNYKNNMYISLRDLAASLANTTKSFNVVIAGKEVTLVSGEAYEIKEGDNEPFTDDIIGGVYHSMTIARPDMSVNNMEVKYYAVNTDVAGHGSDIFMKPVDIAMALDMKIDVQDDCTLSIDTGNSFSVSMDKLEEEGYMQCFNSVIVGDSDSGDIYYAYNEDSSVAIASTTKLMNCLIVMDSIAAGNYSTDSVITMNSDVEAVSVSADGTFKMAAGSTATVNEMLRAMLLPSSNEAALALAIFDAGSEEAFVEKMNAKAKSLGMDNSVFVNCNGLPKFMTGNIPAKVQNQVSAKDLFVLASHILTMYPQVTDITSLKSTVIESYGQKIKNINPLLYNISSVDGMKTGETKRAGACLVSSMKVSGGDTDSHIVAVVLGAEGAEEQTRGSELLLRYGRACYNADNGISEESDNDDEIPLNMNGVVTKILKHLKNKQ